MGFRGQGAKLVFDMKKSSFSVVAEGRKKGTKLQMVSILIGLIVGERAMPLTVSLFQQSLIQSHHSRVTVGKVLHVRMTKRVPGNLKYLPIDGI